VSVYEVVVGRKKTANTVDKTPCSDLKSYTQRTTLIDSIFQ